MKKLILLVCASLMFSACGAVSEKISGESKSGAGDKPQVGETVLFKGRRLLITKAKSRKSKAANMRFVRAAISPKLTQRTFMPCRKPVRKRI
jgi:hypothetical protein